LSLIAKEKLRAADSVLDVQRILDEVKAEATANEVEEKDDKPSTKKAKPTPAKKTTPAKKKTAKRVPNPSISNLEYEDEDDLSMPDLSAENDETKVVPKAIAPERKSIRAIGKRKSYVEDNGAFSETE
jgi:UV DNA damage endonuclease